MNVKTIRKWVLALPMAALLGVSLSGNAWADRRHYHTHSSVGIVIGPSWGPGWDPDFYPSPFYYPPYPRYSPYPPAVIIERSPPVYIEQPAQPPAEPAYWYYCPSSRGYYPYVKSCPSGWQRVSPQPPGQP